MAPLHLHMRSSQGGDKLKGEESHEAQRSYPARERANHGEQAGEWRKVHLEPHRAPCQAPHVPRAPALPSPSGGCTLSASFCGIFCEPQARSPPAGCTRQAAELL